MNKVDEPLICGRNSTKWTWDTLKESITDQWDNMKRTQKTSWRAPTGLNGRIGHQINEDCKGLKKANQIDETTRGHNDTKSINKSTHPLEGF